MTKNVVEYINTDLDIYADEEFGDLDKYFISAGWVQLYYGPVTLEKTSYKYRGTYEVARDYHEPDKTLRKFIQTLKKLKGDYLAVRHKCPRKVFDVGYRCGPPLESNPSESEARYSLTQIIPPTTLSEMVRFGAEIAITIYPECNRINKS